MARRRITVDERVRRAAGQAALLAVERVSGLLKNPEATGGEVLKAAQLIFERIYRPEGAQMGDFDILIKEEGEITAFEVKSSMTYNKEFEAVLKKLPGWIKTPVRRKAVVYSGDFENNAGDIEIINYKNLRF